MIAHAGGRCHFSCACRMRRGSNFTRQAFVCCRAAERCMGPQGPVVRGRKTSHASGCGRPAIRSQRLSGLTVSAIAPPLSQIPVFGKVNVEPPPLPSGLTVSEIASIVAAVGALVAALGGCFVLRNKVGAPTPPIPPEPSWPSRFLCCCTPLSQPRLAKTQERTRKRSDERLPPPRDSGGRRISTAWCLTNQRCRPCLCPSALAITSRRKGGRDRRSRGSR